jgi:hypothetical protein
MAVKQDMNQIFVRVAFSGFIPECNCYGPLKTFVAKDKIISMIKSGYDVTIMNPSVCPEFCEQLKLFYEALKAKRIQEQNELIQRMLIADNPMAKAAAEAKKKQEELAKQGVGVTSNGGNPTIEAALAQADKQMQQAGIVAPTPDEIARQKDYSNQLDQLGGAVGADVDFDKATDLSGDPNFATGPNMEGVILPEGNSTIEAALAQADAKQGIVNEEKKEDDVPSAILPPVVEQQAEATAAASADDFEIPEPDADDNFAPVAKKVKK